MKWYNLATGQTKNATSKPAGDFWSKTEKQPSEYHVYDGEDFVFNPRAYANDKLAQRDKILKETDWQIVRHLEESFLKKNTTLSEEQFIAITEYRQYLRDFTILDEWYNKKIRLINQTQEEADAPYVNPF